MLAMNQMYGCAAGFQEGRINRVIDAPQHPGAAPQGVAAAGSFSVLTRSPLVGGWL